MKKTKILVDAISLLSSLTGIGRYTYEVSKYLKKSQISDIYFFYGYNSSKLIKPSSSDGIKSIKSIVTKNPLLKKIMRKVLVYFTKMFSNQYDLYWQPNFIPNSGVKARKIVTSVHDFSFILHKEFHPRERIKYFEDNFFQNIYRSDMIITGSEFSKNEILERTTFIDEQIKVIYHGIDHTLFKQYEKFSLSFNLPQKFIFSVGSIEPRKNLLGLLNAYNLLDEDYKKEYSLVLAGFKGWENMEIMSLIEANQQYIEYLGYISDVELAMTYNKASLFLFPSFYEGFGLPVIEAMACGIPVITSNVASLPEVGGDAVVYCDPYSVEDIKQKIELVLSDEALQKQMIRKGLARAKEFSWEKSAQEHIKVFEEAMKS